MTDSPTIDNSSSWEPDSASINDTNYADSLSMDSSDTGNTITLTDRSGGTYSIDRDTGQGTYTDSDGNVSPTEIGDLEP